MKSLYGLSSRMITIVVTAGLMVSAVCFSFGAPLDFNGDGKTDMAVYGGSPGTWYSISVVGGGFSATAIGTAGSALVPGDYDGNGSADPAVFNPNTAMWTCVPSGNNFWMMASKYSYGWSAGLTVTGDYDGDGKTDPALYDKSTTTWYIMQSRDGFKAEKFGFTNGTPVPADYDNDGTNDLAVYKEGKWRIKQSTLGLRTNDFGWDRVYPVVGNYDGDGKVDLAFFDQQPANWHIKRSSDGVEVTNQFGWSEAKPVPGDYDGDGTNDLAVYHQAAGMWYIMRSRDGFITNQFGWSGGAAVGVPRRAGNWALDGTYAAGASVPVSISFRSDWVLEADMINLHPGGGYARYMHADHTYGIDYFLGPFDSAFRLANRAIWFTNAVLGGISNPATDTNSLPSDDHVAQTVAGSYKTGNHTVRMEYLLSANPDPNKGVCRMYWDGTKIGDWDFWVEWFPNSMRAIKVGWYDGRTTFDSVNLRYYQGSFVSLDDQ